MARRADPENLYLAHRAGHVSRLVSQGRMSLDAAERLIVAWEAEAALRGLDRHSELLAAGVGLDRRAATRLGCGHAVAATETAE